jgi:hypothetical protein
MIPNTGARLNCGYMVGVDLGQAQDWTAISVVEMFKPNETTPRHFHVRHLERPQLGTSYVDICGRVRGLMQTPPLRGRSWLCVDKTGVGAAVVDLMRAQGLRPYCVTITGGDAWSWDEVSNFRVPKRDLAGTLQAMLATDRLKIANGIQLADTLSKELHNFKVKVNIATGNDSYEAHREGDHDDLVLSVAMACWVGDAFGRMSDRRTAKLEALAANPCFY